MKEKQFLILFDASLTGKVDLDTTRCNFGKLFDLNPAELDRLFSGKPFIVKKDLCETNAADFALTLANAGCHCDVEAMPDISRDTTEESRHSDTRRMRHRRGPRPGATISDRRQNHRRLEDVEYFKELILSQSDAPA